MLKPKDYILFILLEMATVPLVISIFKFIEPKKMAAVVAGTVFVSLGFFLYSKSFRARKSLTFYVAFAHLFFFSIPMLSKRLFYWNSDFKEILFYGISGPQFHKISETFFIVLLSASLIDLIRLKLKDRASRI